MLNAFWAGCFVLALLGAGLRYAGGDAGAFSTLTQALFADTRKAVEVALGLAGAMAFWTGLLRIAEQAGLVQRLAQALAAPLARLMPAVPAGHPAVGAVCLNLAANVFGLDNAATPFGLRAMRELQRLNPRPDTASDPQILFLVLNTSSVTLLPVSVFALRAEAGAKDPTDVYLPILLATTASTLTGLVLVARLQRLALLHGGWGRIMAVLALLLAALSAAGWWLPGQSLQETATLTGNLAVYLLIVGVLWTGLRRKVDIYAAFVTGAREGLNTTLQILPYLVGMLAALGALRAGGVLDGGVALLRVVVSGLGADARIADALPAALVKPFSGSAARAALVEIMHTHGADSLAGKLASVVQGSTETTFYVLAVYFGAVGISQVRYAVWCGLAADLAAVVAASALACCLL